jgi:hypothetical protein
MKVGDLVEKKRLHGLVTHGIVVEVHRVSGWGRVGTVSVLKEDGKIGKWYASYVKVVK